MKKAVTITLDPNIRREAQGYFDSEGIKLSFFVEQSLRQYNNKKRNERRENNNKNV